MNTCESCKFGVFCPTWAEWKCTKKCEIIEDPINLDCKYNKKRGKDDEEPECHCETCMERESLDDEE